MKPNVTLMRLFVVLALAIVGAMAWSANTKQTVSQVSSSVSLTANVDYVISSATPFTGNGVVNIQNIDHAVLILSAVKPSVAISQWLSYVKINGETAVNGENCQVKIYNQGCIILPYGDSTKPLTVYDGQNFSGESCNDFGLEDTGGFMNTLTDAKLNNRIRSFKLKRGYMVTFSLRTGGYGYSRCFIAADQDLEVASLPDIMDQKISSYRVFKWYDASKKGLATADNNFDACSALNATSTYTWGVGHNMAPDVESIPHHIKENWPGAAELGVATWSPHMKTNNEPQNESDDPWVKQSLDEILSNWEGLMATGMRLCSPSSWDGSDYWNATGFLKEFFDSIDTRGWRCDIIDLHGYWVLSNFQTNIPNWYNAVKRPVWVSEWVWGASWNKNGAFAGGVTESQNASNVKSICEYMNGLDYLERYYYWNNERAPSKVINDNGSLTEAGTYYASMNSGLAYKGATNYIPTIPQQKAPSDLTAVTAAGKLNLRWKDYNGELNRSMTLEYRANSSSSWQQVMTIQPLEGPNKYTHTCEATQGAGEYRIHIVDFNGVNRYSNVISLADTKVYYLYNVGARQWLCTGNAWGSHASLTSNGGVDIRLEEVASGKYTIDTQIVNGDNHYLNILDNGPWMDQVLAQWTFSPTENGAYLLSCNGSNLAYDGSTTSLIKTNEKGVNSQWVFQTRDDRMAMLETATSNNPIDATFLIVDNDYARYNDQRRSVWKGNMKFDGYANGSNSNFCVESFNTTFDIYQVINDAPPGKYRLKVQGFYRNGDYAPAATKRDNGTEQLNALLYANEYSQPLQSIFSEAGEKEGKPDKTISYGGYIKFPNEQIPSAQFFAAGFYDDNVLEFTLGKGDPLQLGVKKTVETTNDWTCFDNFRLIYLGNDDVAKMTTKTAAGHCWSTFYSGVANYQLPEGATAYTAIVCDGALHLHELGRVIPKECAVIIVSNSEGLLMMERTDETVDAVSENDLRGADTETLTSNYNGTVYVMGASTEAGTDFGFHRYTGYELPAGKAFLVLGTGQSRPLTICFDEEVTVVDGIHQPTSGKVYNLQGQYVTTPRKGLYMKDGNKVVVK